MGLKELIKGAEVTVKVVELKPVPPWVVTDIDPEEAPAGTVARMEVSERIEKAAAMPLNPTVVAPENWVPVNVIEAPRRLDMGLKKVTVGAEVMFKEEGLAAVPPGVVTVIFPEGAPVGTVTVMEVSDTTVNIAGVPLNFTKLVNRRAVPERLIVSPAAADVGVISLSAGAGGVT